MLFFEGGNILGNYIEPSKLYYSEIFPNGVYTHCENQVVPLPIPDTLNKVKNTQIVKNILTHKLFFCKKIYSSSKQKDVLISEILYPSSHVASWPVDLIKIEKIDENKHIDIVDLRHLYCDEYHNVQEYAANYILLFPYYENDSTCRGGYAYYTPLDAWLKNEPITQKNYKNNNIKRICVSIVHALNKVNKDGYTYFDFNLSRFMLKPDFTVVPEYTNLIMNKDLTNKKITKELSLQYGLIPLDFIEPFVYLSNSTQQSNGRTEKTILFNMSTQNYSLAAMLFYLMFGRKPYEGNRLMQNQDDIDDNVSHYAYLRNLYLKDENIHFIFDNSYDNPNLLTDEYTDMFATEIGLWNECPKELRKIFTNTLNRQNTLRESYVRAPKPDSWVHLFDSLGWGNLI